MLEGEFMKTASFLTSSIGKKQLMGIAGLFWCGFVLTHMLGNLLYLVGPDAYNAYGNSITSIKELYYPLEVALALTLIVHVVFGILVSVENKRARPVGYAVKPGMGTKGQASFGSKTMVYTGLLIFVFIILHLIKFRFGVHYPYQMDGHEIRDLHRLMSETFAGWGYTAWYLVCLYVLGLHLSHALWSSVQTLGLVPNGKEITFLRVSQAFGWIVAIGFALNPIYIFLRG
jgi:succinate dehydrogenase / fumarate reductase cytochrome b subunit